MGMKLLMDEYDLTQAQLAEIVGKSRSGVANTLRILNLDERVLDLAKQGKLTEGHCRALLAYEDGEKQLQEAMKLIENGRTVRDIERKTQRNKPKKVDQRYVSICNDIEDTFQSFFGTKVKVDAGKRSGKIIIQYNTNDDYAEISFERNLYKAGQFSITINYNIPNANKFQKGLFVQFGNDPYDFGEIKSISDSIGSDGKGSQNKIISGYDCRYLFKRRII